MDNKKIWKQHQELANEEREYLDSILLNGLDIKETNESIEGFTQIGLQNGSFSLRDVVKSYSKDVYSTENNKR